MARDVCADCAASRIPLFDCSIICYTCGMQPLQLATELARQAGALQMQHFGKIKRVTMKGAADPVTEVDQACERLIVDGIREAYPEHGIVAEEGAGYDLDHEWQWIIDPLDGTVNYVQGYPLFAVCIALCHKGVAQYGVVFEPNRNEMFTATRGGGAFCNDVRMQVSTTDALADSVLSTGFAYDRERDELGVNIPIFNHLLYHTRALRRDGVAGVDLAYVACGRYDGFWEYYLKPWDIVAGSLLVEEAGGRVSGCDGAPLDYFGIDIATTNGHIHDELIQNINQASCGTPRGLPVEKTP